MSNLSAKEKKLTEKLLAYLNTKRIKLAEKFEAAEKEAIETDSLVRVAKAELIELASYISKLENMLS